MGNVVFVSPHYIKSKRKAGFHWLADAFERRGWDVVFLCAGYSLFSHLRGDKRAREIPIRELNRVAILNDRLKSFVLFGYWHPINLHNAALNRLTTRVFREFGRHSIQKLQPLLSSIRKADLFVFEGGHTFFLYDYFHSINPHARYTYRMSDDMRVLSCHPSILEEEERVVAGFDLISVPSPLLLKRFGDSKQLVFMPHGLSTHPFDASSESPYRERGKTNVISIGSTLFDSSFFDIATDLFPNLDFHVIGYNRKLPKRKNLRYYGEMRFEDIVPYVKFADIGVAAYRYCRGAEYLADSSNKISQYTYCRLPLIAPDFLRREDCGNMFRYRPGDRASIGQAIQSALEFDGSKIKWPNVVRWDEHVDLLAGTPSALADS